MAYFGLDIGSYTIKFCFAERKGKTLKIKTLGSVYNPVGQILPVDGHKVEQLAEVIKKGTQEFGLSGMTCHISLPGNLSLMNVISMPLLTDVELSSAIKWEAEQHIPVSLDEINFEYDVIWRPPKNSSIKEMSVLIVGATKKNVNQYLNILSMAGLEPIGMEPEVLSIQRVFQPEGQETDHSTTLFCNFGALTTSFLVVDQGNLSVVHSVSFGSLALTRAIEKSFSLNPSQSEEYKRGYGIDPQLSEGKVAAVLQPVVETLVQEIRKTIHFHMTRSTGSNGVTRIVLSGGGSMLPGIAAFLAKSLALEVVVGNPIEGYQVDTNISLPNDLTTYSAAIGLAIKTFN